MRQFELRDVLREQDMTTKLYDPGFGFPWVKIPKNPIPKQIACGDWIKISLNPMAEYVLNPNVAGARTEQSFTNQKRKEAFFQFVTRKHGMLQLFGEVTDFAVEFGGAAGYENGTRLQNEICMALFGRGKYGIMAYQMRPIDIENMENEMVNAVWSKREEQYWLADQYVDWIDNRSTLGLYYLDRGSLSAEEMVIPGEDYQRHSHSLKPVLLIPIYNPNIKIAADEQHVGKTKETAMEILMD